MNTICLDIDSDRVRKISSTLKKIFKDEKYINLFIKLDPQYRALLELYRNTGLKYLVAVVSIANSLISYQLTGKGEDYWMEICRYFSLKKNEYKDSKIDLDTVFKLFKEFLESITRYNRFQVATKISRLKKFFSSSLPKKMYSDPCMYSNDQYNLIRTLSSIMGQDIYAKTVVFAAKMYYYASDIIGCNPLADPRVPMPVDRRIATVSLLSGLIKPCNLRYFGNLRTIVYKLMSKYKKLLVKAWFSIASESNIPCIFLDTIIWITARPIIEARILDPVKLARQFIDKYRDVIVSMPLEYIVELYRELVYNASIYLGDVK